MKGRGSQRNIDHRFQSTVVAWEDGCEIEELPRSVPTQLIPLEAGSIVSQNNSPDVPFDQSINPYQGCEHGCVYCFARPTHAYLDHSPGLDFETKIYCKTNGPELLRKKLGSARYQCKVIALGANTDPYQPAERRFRLTRKLLQVLADHRHPVSIVTKSARILDDLDLLIPLARANLVSVMVSVTTLDHDVKRRLEPRAPSGQARLKAIAELARNRIPVGVLVAPIIPKINDQELENILRQSHEAGATTAGYVLLRLPWEIKELFETWLEEHYPLRAGSVMSMLRQCHEGKAYESGFGVRQRGRGVFADLLANRFRILVRKLGMRPDRLTLDTTQFRPPIASGGQLTLF